MSYLRPLALACSALVPTLAGAVDAPAAAAHFRASGNEPAWSLDVGPAETRLLLDFGKTQVVTPTPTPDKTTGDTRYVSQTDHGLMTATITRKVCVDSMSGMPRPATVTVVLGERHLSGCGGDPAQLLQGAEWRVARLDGRALQEGSKATIAFDAGGRVSGLATCNRFAGKYSLTGEGLSIVPTATTRMACRAPLLEQERSFLAMLGAVHAFSIASDGALHLRTSDGRILEATRP